MAQLGACLRIHLSQRLGASFRQLLRALVGVDAAGARLGADPNWRRYRWGTGLDGSIAGIVHHLALWKQIAAAGLETGTFPGEHELSPPDPSWEGLLAWLKDGQTRLAAALDRLPPARLAEGVTWEGVEMTRAELFAHLLEHDQYHAGQINLLRQLRGQVDGA